ncbi:TPA: manganese catalase family protein [Clostridioides difficile]|uniref:manganese catalase family protein n=1 Tax=Clostridioides difficile TaxID=1496 RepID=UPI0006ACBEB4|nr:manganese catalase family protein [Clostridioides difficile]MDC2931544.1 manganese catalase family protein [Clostridioides difficile]MDC9390703.1 manganese catalase family protein [Clostridioides difficile]MDE3612061.1 manganese catalase family protein [Clostridioides difficile]MDK1635929.1 manganese catalase family protein [Clostridioides difficile]MDM9793101.1 manganese catalase family protein [Clostridioides difficile]
MLLNRRELLERISEYQFACIELNLYLDNNPRDKKALDSYNRYCDKFTQAVCDYESRDGALTNFGHGLQPVDSNGVNFTTSYINVFGDSVTDLHEDMAAEQKALATYYQLINLTDAPDLKDILRFLGEREVVHYQRFGEALMDVYEFTECKHQF